MVDEIPSLTLQEKTLLHLLDFKGLEDTFELPPEVTQKGIAAKIGAQRKHMPRILKKLVDSNMVSERRGRVQGSSQSMKVYLLTWNGISKANKIKEFAENSQIRVRDREGNLVEAKIEDVNDIIEGELSLLDIINNISEGGIFEGIVEGIEDVEELEPMPPKHEIYWHTLLQVWKDGRASVDEEDILKELRKILNISDEDHIRMQERIIRYASPVRKKLLDIYSAAYEAALKDDLITDDERALLEALRQKLGLKEDEQKEIEDKINQTRIRS
ncbi:MAG: hypothetical protein JSW00_00770 [Thermoplasmata archaeon]|nr:MAG: hypothetical protein JSW00_00770 [Thermoplasmata archaeon]